MSSDLCSHLRRRPFLNASLPRLSTDYRDGRSPSSHSPVRHPTLRKEATFHVSASPSSPDVDPVLHFPTLLRRSPTSPDTLQEIIAASERRVVGWLGSIESSSTGPGSKSLSKQNESVQALRKGPSARLTSANLMEVDSASRKLSKPPAGTSGKHVVRALPSDSGVGTSIDGDKDSLKAGPAGSTLSNSGDSLLPLGSSLSSGGRKQIQRHILRPLLKEKRLKPFQPLVRTVPQRILSDEITCLRDLEKTLISLAPHHAISRSSYLSFCEFTVQCVHTTVGYLNDRDQRLPEDRPYTNGYFLDLVEQVRQYATLIRTAREQRLAATSKRDDLGYSSGEELVLEGGIATTGRPAELVRKKKGQAMAISLKTGQPYVEQNPIIPSLKRASSMENQASVVRSMARRKKDAPPMNINAKCKHCDKIFRRPCDLSKHEKVHTRPWKCPDTKCKYHELGWPTEKERERHMNDKHTKSPKKYKCRYAGCTYDTKRESNCKQHMEKVHGYTYVRSKNNSKTGTQLTPLASNVSTPQVSAVDIPTPVSAQDTMSPSLSPGERLPIPFEKPMSSGTPSIRAPSPAMYPPSPVFPAPSPSIYAPSDLGPQNTMDDFTLFPDTGSMHDYSPSHEDFNAFYAELQAADPSEPLPQLDMNLPSASSTPVNDYSAGLYAQSPSDLVAATNDPDFQFGVTDSEYTSMNLQLLSPAQSVEAQAMTQHLGSALLCLPLPVMEKHSSISPAGQGNVMLYSPASYDNDEGFADGLDSMDMDVPMAKGAGDFTLFGTPGNSSVATSGIGGSESESWNISGMFPPLGALNDQTDAADWSQGMDTKDVDIDSLIQMDETL